MKTFYIVKDVYSGEWFVADEECRGKALLNLKQWPVKDEMREKQLQAWLNARVINAPSAQEVLVRMNEVAQL